MVIHYNKSPSERTFYILNIIIMCFLAFCALYPIIYLTSISLSSRWAVDSNKVLLWPINFTLSTWKYIIKDNSLLHSLMLNIFVTLSATLFSMLISVLLAYPLSRKRFKLRTVISLLAVFTMILKPPLIPYFLVLASYGLVDNIFALILPHTIIVYNLIILKTFFAQVPDELEDSAFIDGANDFQILFRIILPISKPVLATISLFYAVIIWNQFYHPILFIRSADLFTLQLKIRQFIEMPVNAYEALYSLGANGIMKYSPDTITAGVVIFSTIPILLVYPYLQKYFTKGAILGSLKR